MEENELYEGFGLELPAAEDALPGGEEAPEEAGGESPAEEPAAPAGAERREVPRQEAPRREEVPPADEDAIYAAAYAGRVDPYTGKPITTKAEHERYQAALRAEEQRARMEKLRAAGIDPEAIESIISEHPVVREAQTVIERARAAEREAQTAKARDWYAEQVRQINALDPEAGVGSLDELSARNPEQYARLLDMVGRGMSMVDAYKALNFDALVGRRTAAARQSVRNQTAGKAHLAPAGGQGKAGVEVPGAVRERFKELNPWMTDADIQKAYADYEKGRQ